MRRRGRELLNLYFSPHLKANLQYLSKPSPLSSTYFFQGTRTFSTSSKPPRDSLVLEQFKQRKLKGSSTMGSSKVSSTCDHSYENEVDPTMVFASFKELGVSEELVEAMEKIGDFVPTEIQCVAIPSVLEGKSLLLSSPPEPDRTLAFLLPLIQMLRRDRELLSSNLKHPRAIVLCAAEEKAAQCFNAARYIIHGAELKPAKHCASSDNKQSHGSIGLMIGTPCDILQNIEEGIVIPAEIRYLVLDEADSMLGCGLGLEIHKILRPIQDCESKSTLKKLQTILAVSTIAEVLGNQSPIVKRLEGDHAGNVSAMSLELEQTEVFDFVESLDALRKKVAEAMDSLLKPQ